MPAPARGKLALGALVGLTLLAPATADAAKHHKPHKSHKQHGHHQHKHHQHKVSAQSAATNFSETDRPDGDWTPYGPDSPFNKEIPAAPMVAPNSASLVSAALNGGTASIVTSTSATSTSDQSTPFYYASSKDPLVRIKAPGELNGRSIRIPSEAKPSAGAKSMTVLDNAKGVEYTFSRVSSKTSNTITAASAENCDATNTGLDCGGDDADFGGMAGKIRYEELAAAVAAKGSLKHALFLTVGQAKKDSFVYPANEGVQSGSSSGVELGRLLQLNMTDAQINALQIPEWRKVIARTMAHYGGFVGAVKGKGLGFQFESGVSYTAFRQSNPFAKLADKDMNGIARSGSVYSFRTINVPWSTRLRALDESVARDAPAADDSQTGAGSGTGTGTTTPKPTTPTTTTTPTPTTPTTTITPKPTTPPPATTTPSIPSIPTTPTVPTTPVDSSDNFGLSWEDMPYGKSANRQRIPANAPTAANASAINATLMSTLAAYKPAATVSGEVPTVNVASPSDPTYKVTLSANGITLNLPIPKDLVMGTGADHPTLIRYPFPAGGYPAYTELRIWQGTVNHTSKTLDATRGGLHNYGPNGDAGPILGNGLGDGRSWTGLMLANQFRKTGDFHEALRFTTNTGWSSKFMTPAIKSDQSGSGPLVMGQRWQLNITDAELLSRTVPGDNPQNLALLRAMMRAMRDYGLYLGDGGGPGFLLEMEDDATAHWSDIAGPALVSGGQNYGYGSIIRSRETAGGSGYRATDGIPWSKLRPLAQSTW